MEQQAGTPTKKHSTCGIIVACVIGFFGIINILGLFINESNKADRANFVASLETPAFDAKALFDVDRSKAEEILGAPTSDVGLDALITSRKMGNGTLSGATSTFWKKGDFVIWVTSPLKKPIDQVCVIDPNSKYTTSEVLKKVSLASSTENYSILGNEDGNGFCACIKKSQNPFCKEQAATIAKKNAEQEKVGKVCAEHPGWERDICGAVANKKVRIGMTQEQVVAAWGRPTDINKTISSGSVEEQWVYGLGSYLYFGNGILRTIQN